MSEIPLMPKATAVWLVENTSLTFDQIAEFCKLHPLEVKGIADGEVATGIKGYDPISTGQLTREEIGKAERNPNHRLELAHSKVRVPEFKKPRGARYTPLSRRQDRPNAILWLLRNHAELKDAQIMRLVGTTKHTLEAIRERSHWNSANLQPMDPVTLGLCSQIDLDFEVNRAAKDRPKVEEDKTQTLVSAEITTARPTPTSTADVFGAPTPKAKTAEDKIDVNSVFGKLKEHKNADLWNKDPRGALSARISHFRAGGFWFETPSVVARRESSGDDESNLSLQLPGRIVISSPRKRDAFRGARRSRIGARCPITMNRHGASRLPMTRQGSNQVQEVQALNAQGQ